MSKSLYHVVGQPGGDWLQELKHPRADLLGDLDAAGRDQRGLLARALRHLVHQGGDVACRRGIKPKSREADRAQHQTASTASTIQSAPNHIAAPCMQHHGHFYLEAGGKGGKSGKIYHGTCG